MNQRRPGRAAAKPICAFRLVMPSRIALFCAVCTLGVAVRPERGGGASAQGGGGITLPARPASGWHPDHGARQGLCSRVVRDDGHMASLVCALNLGASDGGCGWAPATSRPGQCRVRRANGWAGETAGQGSITSRRASQTDSTCDWVMILEKGRARLMRPSSSVTG